MLQDYKEYYKNTASIIPNWNSMSKNELCRQYILNEDNKELSDGYLAALLCKYWELIQRYYDQSPGVCEPEDVYSWLVDSILYAIKHRRWEDEDSSIFNDENGPDKVINRQMKCRRATFYQSLNRYKRDGKFSTSSIEDYESNDISNENLYSVEDNSSEYHIKEYIKQKFLKKQYETAFILDVIAFDQTFRSITATVNSDKKFSKKLLVDTLSEIGEKYLKEFSERYNLECKDETDCNDVLYTKRFLLGNDRNKWHERVDKTLNDLRTEEFFRALKEGKK